MTCPSCHAESLPSARFCAQCGARLTPGGSAKRSESHNGASEKGERRQLTVMFCDLVGSTTLSERLDPEDLLELVRSYQRVAADVVGRYDGTVAQYLGDGILAYFGYPTAHEDDPRRAVTSGLEIVKALTSLNQAMAAQRRTAIAVRIAVHTGEVVAAEIADGELLALGSTPNVAARVQSLANPGEVWITEATHARVRYSIQCSHVGSRALQGLAKPVVLYRAVEPVRADASLPTASSDQPPLVGRDTAIGRVLQCLTAARAGKGQAVFIRAEAGFGKSRLLQEIRGRLPVDGQSWFTCACSPYHQDTSFYALAGFVEQLVGIDRGDPPEARLAKLETKLRELGLETDEAMPLLSTVLSIHGDGQPRSSLPPDRQRHRTLELLFELLKRATPSPVVFAVEDLHWVDPSTLEFLGQLIDRFADEPILAVFTSRPVFQPPWDHRLDLELELPPLTDREAQQMVAEWSVAKALGPGVAKELVSRAGGVPLFLEELTKAVVDVTGVEEAVVGAATVTAVTTTAVIPGTLRDPLTARLDTLGAAKEVAQLGAVLGREFRYDILLAISALDSDTLDRHLDRIVESGLFQRSGNIPDALFAFKHALIQESAYESMLRARRRTLHDRVVDVLNRQFPALAEREPETIGRHCEDAGRFDEASAAWQRAATRASEQWAYVEAIRGFRKALATLERLPVGRSRDERELELLVALRDPVFATSGYAAPDQPKLHSRIRQLAKTLGGRVDELSLVYSSWGFHCVHNDRQEALDARREIEEIAARTAHPSARAVADWVSGATDFYDGQQSRALARLGPVVDAFRTVGPETNSAQDMTAGLHFLAWLVHGWALAIAGHVTEALTSLSDAVTHAEKYGPFGVTQALSHQIAATWVVGPHLGRLRELAHRELALSQEHQLPQTLYLARHCLGWITATTGDERGIEEMLAAIEGTRGMGTLVITANHLVLLADAFGRFGRDDEALDTVNEALNVCTRGLGRYYEPLAHQIKGELLWKRGDHVAGEASLRSALRVAENQNAQIFELRAAMALARSLCDVGRGPEGREPLAKVCGRLQGQPDDGYLGHAKALLARLSELR